VKTRDRSLAINDGDGRQDNKLMELLGDMHRAAAKAKDAMPYRGVGAESEGKKVGQQTGAKLDQAVSQR
jgi:hypothetical protein